jgi:hypothetical protein
MSVIFRDGMATRVDDLPEARRWSVETYARIGELAASVGGKPGGFRRFGAQRSPDATRTVVLHHWAWETVDSEGYGGQRISASFSLIQPDRVWTGARYKESERDLTYRVRVDLPGFSRPIIRSFVDQASAYRFGADLLALFWSEGFDTLPMSEGVAETWIRDAFRNA